MKIKIADAKLARIIKKRGKENNENTNKLKKHTKT
jgi:hypothetical protein